MAGVSVAYFLVHMLGSGRDYARRERAAAAQFARAASAAGVERIVYLGGLGPDEGGSPHLDSRHHTAEALRRWGPPLTYFRAAMIIGPHSESYELLRSIAAKLPALPEPEWLRSQTQPIGIRDVVAYLRDARRIPRRRTARSRSAGPTSCSTSTSSAASPRRPVAAPPLRIPLPDGIASPGVVAAGAASVTAGSPAVAAELSLGLSDDTSVKRPERGSALRHQTGAAQRRDPARAGRAGGRARWVTSSRSRSRSMPRSRRSGTSSWTLSASANG